MPSACLRNEKTTTSLKKLVIISISEGANTSRVKMMTRFRLLTSSLGEFGAEIERSILGIFTTSAPFKPNTNKNISAKALMLSPLFWLLV